MDSKMSMSVNNKIMNSMTSQTPTTPSERSVSVQQSTNRTTVHASKRLIKGGNIRKRNDLEVIYQGLNVTPKCLPPIDTIERSDVFSLTQLGIRSNVEINLFGNLISASALQDHIHSMHTQSLMAINPSQPSVTNLMSSSATFKADTYEDDYSRESRSDSWDDLESPYNVHIVTVPNRIKITLSETGVIYLLEINSTTEVKGTDEANVVEKDNELYDFLTVGKGKNRKMKNAEIQTQMSMLKTRSTLAKRPDKKNGYAFATEWDMLDSFENKSDVSLAKPTTYARFSFITEEDEEDQMQKLLKNPDFQFAVMVMERALANNVFSREQKLFRGIIYQDPFRPNIQFNYGLNLLWTFKTPVTEGHPIICMQWHPTNPEILACGYGKFLYSDCKKGIVYCWNIKNPTQPEREYYFQSPVTSLSFSQNQPNYLGVGLYDGTIAILDIAPKDVYIVTNTIPSVNTSYEPIWDMEWFEPDDYSIGRDYIVAICEDGSISSYKGTQSNDLIRLEMFRTFLSVREMQGVKKQKECAANEIPIAKNASALRLKKHPIDTAIFFVGTGEGAVYKCSKFYEKQYVSVFCAHSGPVYSIQFSDFCTKLFLTCGSDSKIRLWIEDLRDPLITLTMAFNPIDGAEWCPSHATIIANISNTSIVIWDLQRKTYQPAREHYNPNNCRNTTIKFSPSGKNLAVGDIEGNLHIFLLEDLPFPPFYQTKTLEHVLFKNLVNRPDIVRKIRRCGLTYQRRATFEIA